MTNTSTTLLFHMSSYTLCSINYNYDHCLSFYLAKIKFDTCFLKIYSKYHFKILCVEKLIHFLIQIKLLHKTLHRRSCQKLPCNQGDVGVLRRCWKVTPGPLLWPVMEKWYDMRTQDVVDITMNIPIALHYNQVRLLATQYPIQNHQNAPTKSIPFQHAGLRIMLVCAAINPGSAVSMTKCKSGFVTEQNPVPACGVPDEMTSSPFHPGTLANLRLIIIRPL